MKTDTIFIIALLLIVIFLLMNKSTKEGMKTKPRPIMPIGA